MRASPTSAASAFALGATMLLFAACWTSRAEVDRVIERAKPLVAAIHSYERATGEPPVSLDALVPRYLAAVPSTGLNASPDFDYTFDRESKRSWRLVVKMPEFGFKHMRYDPSGKYEVPVTRLHDGWVMVDP